jgi:hypothetical protein
VLRRLAEALPAVKVLILADRGFGDQKLYRFLTEELKFDYLIRFRGNIAVTSAEGETKAYVSRRLRSCAAYEKPSQVCEFRSFILMSPNALVEVSLRLTTVVLSAVEALQSW